MHDPTTNLGHASRSAQPMLWIGERCHLPSCHREDFLPFKCGDCHENFCASHFRPDSHSCSAASASKRASGDFYVPLCPLCHEPPAGWRRDEDPNIAMERHLSARAGSAGACPALGSDGLLAPGFAASGSGGRAASSASPAGSSPRGSGDRERAPRVKGEKECRFRKCRKIMVVPITCQACALSFCPSHRAPAQHECGGAKPAAAAGKDTKSAAATASRDAKAAAAAAAAGIRQKLAAAKASATDAAEKRSASTAPPSDQAPQHGASSSASASASSSSSPFNLFDKTDKRAKAELKSSIKAMQARQARGLLTKAEEVRLAELMAKMHVRGGAGAPKEKDGDCTIA